MNTLIILGAKYLFAVVVLGAAVVGLVLPKERRLLFVAQAVLTTVIALALTKLAGALYFDPRPFTHGVTALIAHEADNGFPSDHTVLSVAAATIALQANRKLGMYLLALALVVGFCRFAAGLHSPLDVVTGALIGAVSAWLGYILAKLLLDTRRGTIKRS